MKNAIFCLLAALLLADCRKVEPQNQPSQSGSVNGSFTLEGKTEKLNHVYARRMPHSDVGVLVTTKPVPESELPALFENLSPISPSKFNGQQDSMKANRIDGFFFYVDKRMQGQSVPYNQYFIRAGRIADQPMYQAFERFSLTKGRILAKCGKGSEVSFEVNLQGGLLCEEHEGTPPPASPVVRSEQGTAQGQLTMNGKSIELKYAYAQRKRLFFDEPEEQIEIIITDRALFDQEVMNILNQPDEREIQSLRVYLGCDSDIAGVKVVYKGKDPIHHFTNIEELSITKERLSVRLSDDKEVFRDKFSYSVNVDVPFKR